jgi:hypothetical protein
VLKYFLVAKRMKNKIAHTIATKLKTWPTVQFSITGLGDSQFPFIAILHSITKQDPMCKNINCRELHTFIFQILNFTHKVKIFATSKL